MRCSSGENIETREEGVEEGMVEKELGRGWWRRTRAGCPTGCVTKREKEALSGERRPGGEGPGACLGAF
jgi:hypothetical protein